MSASSGWTSANQWLTVAANTRYRAGAWVRTSATPIDGWFSVRGNTTQSSSDVINQVHYSTMSNGYQWLTFDFDTGPNTSVLLYAGFWAQNTPSFVEVDDLTVTNAAPLEGNYGFLTDYGCNLTEQQARDRIRTMVAQFHITDVQFYDWFANYETPTSGDSWTDPWFHTRMICRQTIAWYIDELHRDGGRAWAYVQSIAAENKNLANPAAKIYPLLGADDTWQFMGDHPLYFANEGWADHQVAVWGAQVAALGFDGIHWDTLGPKAHYYDQETSGIAAFLKEAAPQLLKLHLMQTMNFLDLSWWQDDLQWVVAFPYAEVWDFAGPHPQQPLYDMLARIHRVGVMAYYAEDSATIKARWAEAAMHQTRYLLIGDGLNRLHDPYFPNNLPLLPDEIATFNH
jgi:hypothetical protein